MSGHNRESGAAYKRALAWTDEADRLDAIGNVKGAHSARQIASAHARRASALARAGRDQRAPRVLDLVRGPDGVYSVNEGGEA